MNTYRYNCKLRTGNDLSVWTGEIRSAEIADEQVDADVAARGSSFRMIVGRSMRGNYLCIPDWNIGIELANWDDYFWNYERLTEAYPKLNRIDATSIISAIYELSTIT